MTDFIFFHIRFSFSSFSILNVLTIRDLICVHLTKTWPAAHEQTDNSDLEASSYAPLSPAPTPTPPGPQSSECQRRPLELSGSLMVFRLTTPLGSCSDPSRGRSSLPPGQKVPAQKTSLSAFMPILRRRGLRRPIIKRAPPAPPMETREQKSGLKPRLWKPGPGLKLGPVLRALLSQGRGLGRRNTNNFIAGGTLAI